MTIFLGDFEDFRHEFAGAADRVELYLVYTLLVAGRGADNAETQQMDPEITQSFQRDIRAAKLALGTIWTVNHV